MNARALRFRVNGFRVYGLGFMVYTVWGLCLRALTLQTRDSGNKNVTVWFGFGLEGQAGTRLQFSRLFEVQASFSKAGVPLSENVLHWITVCSLSIPPYTALSHGLLFTGSRGFKVTVGVDLEPSRRPTLCHRDHVGTVH